MEKEKTRGRTRRKQPSQVAGFLYREGRKWCAAALSLCMILNNMASVTWAAESAAEKEVLFKLTSRSLYEALQEAVREETMVDDHFLFEGKEKDVEAYEKLLLLDDDLYELKPEFENKDEVTNAEKKNDLQLRIFASLGWETDPEREYQVVGDEKIIFCLSNASETEQTAVIQVDEKTTEEIVLVPGSAVVIDSKSEEESLEAESGDERKEDGEQEEIENGESEGQAEEENNSEGIKGVGGNSSAGGASGGNGGNSGNGSNGGNGSNSSDSSNSSEREDIVESGSSAEGKDSAESEGTVESEGFAGNENSVGTENSAENEGKADESAADAEENRNDETQEKADAEGQDKESKDSQEMVNKPETGNSQGNTKEPGNTNTQENTNTQDKAEEKDGRKDEEVKNNPASEKEETEKPDKTEAGSNESGKPDKAEAGSNEIGKSDKAESGNNESKKTDKEESENADSGKADKADKLDKTDKSDNKESLKPETSEKSESGNTSTNKGEKTDTEKAGSERSENSDSSKKSESSKDSSDSGSSDNSSDKGKEVSEGISRNVIRLVADNLEVSASDDMEETESAEETTIIDTQEKQKEEVIKEELEEIKAETEGVKTETEEAKEETEEVTTKTEEVKAETASLSDVEDNEIEGELYAPVVVNEESIIVFVTTAEELGLNRAELRKASDSNAKRISPAYEGEVELENVIVQVKADENVLPEGVKLQVKELKQKGEDAAQYEEAKEALDSQGTEYDGMMALDISFLDKKGRETEPDGNVQVFIKVKKEALPEEADLESIAVQHLAEEEGGIFVEEVADCGNKTRGNVDIEAEEHIEAAFEVESFSRFIITWGNDGDTVAIFNVSWVDENDQSLSNEIQDETIVITKAEKFSLYERFGKKFEGYDYVGATVKAEQMQLTDNNIPTGERIEKTINNVTEIEITKLKNIYFLPYRIIVYSRTEENLESTSDSFPAPTENEINVKLYYRKAENTPAKLKITDEIETTGLLTVGPLDGETEAEGAKYAWYKQVNGIWERIEREKISGDLYNIPEETGKSINVALDNGARCYYKAELLDEQGKEKGIKSEAFLVEYYDALQDGSFEDVKIPSSWSENGTGQGGQWAQLTDSTEGFKWKSTTGRIELVNGDSYLHQSVDENLSEYPKGAYDGEQFAELNPQTDGALYQDVLTVPGAKLNWELYHKARDPRAVSGINVGDGTVTGKSADTMYLLIMPKQLAEGITSQEQVLEVIQNYGSYPGAYMAECTTALEEGWKRYGSSYIVGDNQYVTRFFFVAGPTISGSSSVGNFLDKVWFSSQLPPPAEGYGDLLVNKTVSGLSEDEAKEYQILLTLKKDGNVERTITLDDFSKNYQNGAYTDSATFDNLAPGNYTITESIDESLSSRLEQIHGVVQSYVAVNQENAQKGTVADITIKEDETVSVNFNNAYLLPGGSFTVKKIFKDGKQFESDKTKFTGVKFKLEKEGGAENLSDKEATVLNNEITYEGNDAIAKFEFSSILAGTYKLKEIETPSGYQLLTEDITIFVGIVDGVFGCYLKKDDGSLKSIASMGGIVEVINEETEEIPGAVLPDTGGPGLAMFERYGWFLLMLALMMAGVEVRCYGERKYKRAAMTQREELEDSM